MGSPGVGPAYEAGVGAVEGMPAAVEKEEGQREHEEEEEEDGELKMLRLATELAEKAMLETKLAALDAELWLLESKKRAVEAEKRAVEAKINKRKRGCSDDDEESKKSKGVQAGA